MIYRYTIEEVSLPAEDEKVVTEQSTIKADFLTEAVYKTLELVGLEWMVLEQNDNSIKMSREINELTREYLYIEKEVENENGGD